MLARSLCIALSLTTGHAALIASSKLEQCYNDGATPLDCSRRIVVTLAVNSGQNGTEEVHATLDHVEDRTIGGVASELELETPLRISLVKSEALVRYPLTYLRSFNSNPREVIRLHGLGGCNDGALAREPSCGWAIDAHGAAIDDSQGFCCSCGVDQILGVSSHSTRSESLGCDLFGNSQSAHCLRMDALWYAAYTIGPPQLHFTIGVTSTRERDGSSNDDSTHLELGPHATGASSPDASVTARLLGDFASYTEEMRDLGSTKYLFVPSQPATHPRYVAGMASWLLVDKADVSVDGSVCNKVGTSYSAFRHQSNSCGRSAGACLANQLEDMQQEEDGRLHRGEAPQRRISAFEEFSPYIDHTSGSQYIAFVTQSMRASVVTLTLDADDIRFVIAESTGRIDAVMVRDFEAQSDDGTLLAHVTNTGRMNADYSLRVSCSAGILGMEARSLSLVPSEQQRISFALYAETAQASAYACNVLLFGSRQTLLDSKNVTFRTSALVEERGAQGGTPVSAVGRSEEGADKLGTINACDYWCVKFYDVSCFMTFGCTGKLWRLVLIVLVIIFVCCCCCGCFKSAAFRHTVLNICCCKLFGGSSAMGHARQDWRNYTAAHSRDQRVYLPKRSQSRQHGTLIGDRGREAEASLFTVASNADRQLSRRASQSTLRPMKPFVVYLNLSGERATAASAAADDSLLKSPGASFSLRGEITLTPAAKGETAQFSLGLHDQRQHKIWCCERQQHVPQHPPARLNRSFFCLPLRNEDGSDMNETLSIISASPCWPCINVKEDSVFVAANSVSEPRIAI